jgi:hypothetical protein
LEIAFHVKQEPIQKYSELLILQYAKIVNQVSIQMLDQMVALLVFQELTLMYQEVTPHLVFLVQKELILQNQE